MKLCKVVLHNDSEVPKEYSRDEAFILDNGCGYLTSDTTAWFIPSDQLKVVEQLWPVTASAPAPAPAPAPSGIDTILSNAKSFNLSVEMK